MSNYTIRTLTPTHVGSGETLLSNYEYLSFPDYGEIGIIDDKKVLQLIGKENLSAWVSTLDDKGNLLDYLHTRTGGNLEPERVSQRTLMAAGTMPNLSTGKATELREQIHTAGKPYIPGSSLKGSLRTAMLRLYIEEDGNNDFYDNKYNTRDRRGRFNDTEILKRHFGNDPNHDIFRLIRTGDSLFEKTNCLLSRSINLMGRGWKFDDGIQQYIECIPAHEETTLRISFNELLEKTAATKRLKRRPKHRGGHWEPYHLFPKKKVADLHPEKLFYFVNQHTSILIEDELKFWENEKSYPDEIAEYIGILEDLKSDIAQLNQGKTADTCILRLGWGSGFKSMTGDWQVDKFLDRDFDQLIKELRPKHNINLPYPKTRRMAENGMPLGFVRISK